MRQWKRLLLVVTAASSTNSPRPQEAILAFKMATEILIDNTHFHEGRVKGCLPTTLKGFIFFFSSPKKWRVS
jgi:hypothetical protein